MTPVYEVTPPESANGAVSDTMVEVGLMIATSTSRLAIRAPGGTLGRAEAMLGERSWAAKHYWTEAQSGDPLTFFEFDEPLPAGPVLLRVPISRG